MLNVRSAGWVACATRSMLSPNDAMEDVSKGLVKMTSKEPSETL